MDPKETIKKNLERRSRSVDIAELYKEVPKPTWVELSLIDACNRKCTFCPKADEKGPHPLVPGLITSRAPFKFYFSQSAMFRTFAIYAGEGSRGP